MPQSQPSDSAAIAVADVLTTSATAFDADVREDGERIRSDLRDAVRRLRARRPAPPKTSDPLAPLRHWSLRLPSQAPAAIPPGAGISAYLDYHDRDLVVVAYRSLLGRDPDAAGMNAFLHEMRSGNLGLVGLIAALSGSDEGRRLNRRPDRLLRWRVAEKILRVPLLGWLALGLARPVLGSTWADYLKRLRAHDRPVRRDEVLLLRQRIEELERTIESLKAAISQGNPP